MSLTPQQIAAAERMYDRSRRAFNDLVRRVRSTPAGQPAQDVAALANGIFLGTVTNDPEGMVRSLQHLVGVVAYAATAVAYAPPTPGTYNLAAYTATEGGHADA